MSARQEELKTAACTRFKCPLFAKRKFVTVAQWIMDGLVNE